MVLIKRAKFDMPMKFFCIFLNLPVWGPNLPGEAVESPGEAIGLGGKAGASIQYAAGRGKSHRRSFFLNNIVSMGPREVEPSPQSRRYTWGYSICQKAQLRVAFIGHRFMLVIHSFV